MKPPCMPMVVSGTAPLVPGGFCAPARRPLLPGGLLAPRAPPPAPWRPGKALAACALAAGGLAAPPARASAAAVWQRPPMRLRHRSQTGSARTPSPPRPGHAARARLRRQRRAGSARAPPPPGPGSLKHPLIRENLKVIQY